MKSIIIAALAMLLQCAGECTTGPYWDVKPSTAASSASLQYSVAIKGPKPWRDVVAYGATCDGADASVGIQAAITAASNGDVIFIPPCTHHLTNTITINKSIGIVGSYGEGSILQMDSLNKPIFTWDTSGTGLYHVEMDKISLQTSTSGTVGVDITGTGASSGLKHSSIHNCTFGSGLTKAINLRSVGSDDWIKIADNEAEGPDYFVFRTSTGTGLTITGNNIVASTAAIYVRGSNFGDYVITGNNMYQSNTWSNCIYLESIAPNVYHDNVTIVGNHFDGNTTQKYVKFIGVRSSMVIGNTMAGQLNVVDEDSTSSDNIIQVGYGLGLQFDKAMLINDTPTTNRSVFGSTVPIGGAPLTVHTTTNLNVAVASSTAVGSAATLNFVDDANTTNIIAEYRASKHIFNVGPVGVNTGSPTALLHLAAGTASANTSPFKFTSGTNLTSAEAGAMEWNGTNLFMTQTSGPTRKTLSFTDSNITGTAAGLSSTLAIGSGGTNSATALSGSSIMVSNGSAVIQGAAGTSTTLLHGNASGTPTYSSVVNADLTAGSFTSITGLGTQSIPVVVSTAVAGAFVVNTTGLVVNGATSRVGVGVAPIAGVMQIKAATDHDLLISDAVSVSGAIALNGINDSNGANIPIELRASIIQISAGLLSIQSSTPASASAAGVAGTITWDSSFIYICVASNTWKRVAIATW